MEEARQELAPVGSLFFRQANPMRIRVPCLTRPQQLGHEDLKAIEHHIAFVRNEELAREYAAEAAASGK